MLTVKELKELLNEYDDNLPVYLSSDPEGNSYCVLSENCFGFGYARSLDYFLEDIKSYKKLTPELIDRGYSEEDLAEEDDKEILVIFPG